MVYELEEPVEFGNETIKKLEVREKVFGKDWIKVQNETAPGDSAAMQIVCVTNKPIDFVKMLGGSDYFKLLAISNKAFSVGKKKASANTPTST